MFSEIENNSKSIQSVCMYLVISIILIIIFVISPLKNFKIASNIGKIASIALLGYALYQNIMMTQEQQTKTDLVCGYILSLFIFVLIISIVRKFFITHTIETIP